MATLAFLEGLSPIHLLIMLVFLLGSLAVAGAIVWLVVRYSNKAVAQGPHMSPAHPADSELDRRQRSLELDRMAIENEERRRKLGQQ